MTFKLDFQNDNIKSKDLNNPLLGAFNCVEFDLNFTLADEIRGRLIDLKPLTQVEKQNFIERLEQEIDFGSKYSPAYSNLYGKNEEIKFSNKEKIYFQIKQDLENENIDKNKIIKNIDDFKSTFEEQFIKDINRQKDLIINGKKYDISGEITSREKLKQFRNEICKDHSLSIEQANLFLNLPYQSAFKSYLTFIMTNQYNIPTPMENSVLEITGESPNQQIEFKVTYNHVDQQRIIDGHDDPYVRDFVNVKLTIPLKEITASKVNDENNIIANCSFKNFEIHMESDKEFFRDKFNHASKDLLIANIDSPSKFYKLLESQLAQQLTGENCKSFLNEIGNKINSSLENNLNKANNAVNKIQLQFENFKDKFSKEIDKIEHKSSTKINNFLADKIKEIFNKVLKIMFKKEIKIEKLDIKGIYKKAKNTDQNKTNASSKKLTNLKSNIVIR